MNELIPKEILFLNTHSNRFLLLILTFATYLMPVLVSLESTLYFLDYSKIYTLQKIPQPLTKTLSFPFQYLIFITICLQHRLAFFFPSYK